MKTVGLTVVQNLEERGLVTRAQHPWHHKVLEVRLTDAGAELLAHADRETVRIDRTIFDELTPEERDSLKSLLARCVDALHRS
ncbi:MarR family winged helix-turn-helix transcriptional regulator [Streptomyces sp. NPDC048507]|uniref:MarR family winged helix-turn-helix transcriptional regulator n=1 Tax=Streptomyces sp. NPDC048507 TaxID=3365560 RepID=UPI00372187CD